MYPQWHTVSFTVVAKHHINELRKYVEIYEMDELAIKNVEHFSAWGKGKRMLLHPIFYPLTDNNIINIRKAHKIREICDKLGGFEVADSNRISQHAVEVANMFDLIMLPSTYSKLAYESSGVETPCEVVPHGVSRTFMKYDKTIHSRTCKELAKLKTNRNLVYVLYFLLHSGWRKGADLVYQVMKQIQSKYRNVVLVVKRADIIDPWIIKLRELKMIEIAKWMNEQELVELYDICDIFISFSRGGGFELNSIEALARGIPTIVPNDGCYLDYSKYAITVEIERHIKLWYDNPIHIGDGFEISIQDAVRKLTEVIDHLEEYREKFWKQKEEIWRIYNWERTGKLIFENLRKYGFIDMKKSRIFKEKEITINL